MSIIVDNCSGKMGYDGTAIVGNAEDAAATLPDELRDLVTGWRDVLHGITTPVVADLAYSRIVDMMCDYYADRGE